MGKRTSYEPGTFSWVELSTTDPDGAKEFYGGLFGWDAEDNEVPGGGGTYTMLKLDGEYVGALQRKPEQQDALPPYWFNYVTVASADEAAATAKKAGGTVHMDPFDVGDSGRMTVIMDPTGAAFGVWEPKDHIGAGLVNAPGSLTWNELATKDPDAAAAFYSQLFGWACEDADTGGGPRYLLIGHAGAASGRGGGIRELTPMEEGIPPHWVPYFAVADVDASLARAEELGGTGLMPPMDVPAGRFAAIRDPQGAAFCVFNGDFDE